MLNISNWANITHNYSERLSWIEAKEELVRFVWNLEVAAVRDVDDMKKVINIWWWLKLVSRSLTKHGEEFDVDTENYHLSNKEIMIILEALDKKWKAIFVTWHGEEVAFIEISVEKVEQIIEKSTDLANKSVNEILRFNQY